MINVCIAALEVRAEEAIQCRDMLLSLENKWSSATCLSFARTGRRSGSVRNLETAWYKRDNS